ncbi:MAG: regulatory iron-sulfur-containing complex subunit RicT [Alistipes sp.]|nr:regulatory iron-sulfur-containing complex subunit RicT [Alistipes sp.]
MSCNKKHTPEIGRGCRFCDCGNELEAFAMEGCYKLHETNWLEEYSDNIPTDIFEVRFKNTRRSYYQNVNNLELKRGDIVAVEAQPGHDIGIISLTGDMVAKQMCRVGFNPHNGEFKKIYRKARPYDIERWQEAIALEHETMIASRQIAADMGLNMKIGDVEYQGDRLKAIFYYIADERVDFRELIKVFADRFRIRIEMKQIGARQEAGRIGGIGACGRELCCASWMSSFSSVTTNAARMQEISLNPQKLAGQCSKLKCCLMYEYDVYADARRTIPRLREPLQALDGEYYLVKIDPLAQTMSFSTSKGSLANLTTLSISRVKEIIALNRAGQKVETLIGDEDGDVVEEPTYRHAEDSITRFDNKSKRSKRSKRRSKDRPTEGEVAAEPKRESTATEGADVAVEQRGEEQKPHEQKPRRDRGRRNEGRAKQHTEQKPDKADQKQDAAKQPKAEQPRTEHVKAEQAKTQEVAGNDAAQSEHRKGGEHRHRPNRRHGRASRDNREGREGRKDGEGRGEHEPKSE